VLPIGKKLTSKNKGLPLQGSPLFFHIPARLGKMPRPIPKLMENICTHLKVAKV
jgi:hypothetical protein